MGAPSYRARMAGITVEQAEAQLALWLEADRRVSTGQAWSHQGRTFSRADAGEIRANIEFWDRQCKRLARGGPLVRGVMPV